MRAANPVLRREVVERWRSRRAPVTLTVYLGLLGGIMYALYRVGTAVLRAGFGFGFDASSAGPLLGRFLVEGLFFFVMLLVLFVGPGYAAAQISGERERRTLALLQVTLLRPVQIVLGKLGAATAWLSLLIVTAVPLGAVAFFLGGFGLTDLLRGFVTLIVIAVSVAAIGLGISSLTRGTTGSIVLTYAVVLGLTLGTFFLAGVEAVLRAVNNREATTPAALYLNPFFALADAVQAARPSDGGMIPLPSPLGVIAEALPGSPLVGGGDDVGVMVEPGLAEAEAVEVIESGVAVPPGAVGTREPPPGDIRPLPPDQTVVADDPVVQPDPGVFDRRLARRPVWLIVLVLYTLLGALGLLVATRRMRSTEPRRVGGVRRRAAAPPVVAGPPLPPGDTAGAWERGP